jgi:succinyl-CoA synthetase alpha subunit
MTAAIKIIRNFYRDSVALMQLSSQLAQVPGIRRALAIMASKNNLTFARETGLGSAAVEAGPNDLLIALEPDNEAAIKAAMAEAERAIDPTPAARSASGPHRQPARSLEMGLGVMPAANLALISTPAEYAAAEALKALRLGLNVMLFSNNVAIDDEIRLKRYARSRGLIVMGPDCGTAIISGIPLGFANVVRCGDIGLAGASGTGLQQVTCLIDRLGGGISHALGTGSHDLDRDVGGITMLQGLDELAADVNTRVIVLVSKPPAQEIAARVLERARAAGKPVVVNFLGADQSSIIGPTLTPAKTLEDAAVAAVALSSGKMADGLALPINPAEMPALSAGQRYVRGLYSGGTFCYEAALLLSEALSPVYSNTPVGHSLPLGESWKSRANALIDLGDDVFTHGRPHPIIDHRLRNERLLAEARDPQTGVVLLDVIIGIGSHPDPAGEIAPVVGEAIARAAETGRKLAVVGFICGTAADPQDLSRQESKLREAGMVLTQSNAQAVRLAARIAQQAAGDSIAAQDARRA